MLELKKNAALGMMLGALLISGTAVQAAAQDTSKAAPPTPQDTSAYSAPSRADTSAPAGTIDTSATSDSTRDSSAVKAGTDSTGESKMYTDSTYTDTSKAWKKNTESDSATTK
jgi:hypothetical protein